MLRFGGHLPPLRPGEIGVASPLVKAYGLRPNRRIVVHGARGDVTLTMAGRYRDASHLFADQALVAPATMATLNPGSGTSAVLVRGTASASALTAAVSDTPVVRVYDRAAYVRAHLPWWLLVLVVLGAAAVTWATSALPARRAAGVPVLEAAKAE